MNSLGRTPAEYSRGARRQQGSLPKTGKTHARRALVAGAWASRESAPGSRHLPLRLAKLPTALQAISWQAQVRLGTRDRQLMATGKNANPVVVAIARALRACMGAMAQHLAVTPNA
jgi:transposase